MIDNVFHWLPSLLCIDISHRCHFQKSTMLIVFIVVDSPPLHWTLVTLVRHLGSMICIFREDCRGVWSAGAGSAPHSAAAMSKPVMYVC